MSVNAPATSGTFAPASLLYYHLSRYFHTAVNVPVAVYRTIDKAAHRARVIKPGMRDSAGKASLRMLHEGWRYLDQAAGSGPAPVEISETLTADRQQLFGILVNGRGTRYGAEVNGPRTGGWGKGQNLALQRTAPFLALRQAEPLAEAVQEGIRLSRQDPAVAKAMRVKPSMAQMVYWMRELSEMALLDFILGQQDRVGNIDFVEEWYWISDGRVEHRTAVERSVPPDLSAFRPQRIRRTWLNDNDAGVRASYSDFAKITHELDGLRHFGAVTYRQLMALDQDLQSKGKLHGLLKASFAIGERELGLIVQRTHEAAAVLRGACDGGRLRFDLEPEEFVLTGSVREAQAGCGVN
jgi:hypothetical protein